MHKMLQGKPNKPQVQLVWLKRDIRTHDHAAFKYAIEAAVKEKTAVLVVYAIEPNIWLDSDTSCRQWKFVEDCLQSLAKELKNAFVKTLC